MNAFLEGFGAGFSAIFQLLLVVVLAGYLTRRKVFSEHMISGISRGAVYAFLPCLIFDKITRGFAPATMPFWWMLPLSALLLFLMGWALTALLFRGEMRRKPEMIPLAFMHNAGYLSVAIGYSLFPDQAEVFGAYTFLFVLVYNPLLWTFGKYFISGAAQRKFDPRELITPPLVANLLATGLVLLGWHQHIPPPVSGAIHLFGEAAIPLAMVVLGGTLATTPFRFAQHWKDISRAFAIKLVIMPLIVLLLMLHWELAASYPMLALFWVLQAAYPQATNLILQIRTYGGNRELACAVLLTCHIGAVISLPLWIGIWRVLS